MLTAQLYSIIEEIDDNLTSINVRQIARLHKQTQASRVLLLFVCISTTYWQNL